MDIKLNAAKWQRDEQIALDLFVPAGGRWGGLGVVVVVRGGGVKVSLTNEAGWGKRKLEL